VVDLDLELAVRREAFAFLRRLQEEFPDALPARRLQQGFLFHGQTVALMSHGLGIWKPRLLAAPLSVLTTAPRANQPPPYEDVLTAEGRLQYAYQGTDPELWTNRALRVAWQHRLPLVYLYGVGQVPGIGTGYLAEFPAYVEADHPGALRVDLVFGGAPDGSPLGVEVVAPTDVRGYATRTSLARLHQAAFRQRVLVAYTERCAMCSLHRPKLLDAAHIVPDGEPEGLAVTANGLSLCKLHHAAYDQLLIGVRPDLRVEVATDVLDEIDGPMLRHGLQELHGQRLRVLPRRPADRPSQERLEWRYERFRHR
jgi:putative restriction endonuclease